MRTKRAWRALIPIACMWSFAVPAASAGGHRGWVTAERTLREARPLAAGGTVTVDNYWGAIRVTATDGSEVTMTATETISARDAELQARARREVTLRVEEHAGGVRFFVDGPFRCQERQHRWCDWDDLYEVIYDFELRVPRQAKLDLATVNDGDIEVDGVRGPFRVANVNGEITLEGMASGGEAHTVNGGVRVTFAENPQADSEFETVNGNVDVTLRRGLGAEFRLRTMNGEIYSDFEYRARPVAEVSESRERGRYVYKVDHTTSISIGSGGPRIGLASLNGDLLIRNQDDR